VAPSRTCTHALTHSLTHSIAGLTERVPISATRVCELNELLTVLWRWWWWSPQPPRPCGAWFASCTRVLCSLTFTTLLLPGAWLPGYRGGVYSSSTLLSLTNTTKQPNQKVHMMNVSGVDDWLSIKRSIMESMNLKKVPRTVQIIESYVLVLCSALAARSLESGGSVTRTRQRYQHACCLLAS
jgi:hypothetical protein